MQVLAKCKAKTCINSNNIFSLLISIPYRASLHSSSNRIINLWSKGRRTSHAKSKWWMAQREIVQKRSLHSWQHSVLAPRHKCLSLLGITALQIMLLPLPQVNRPNTTTGNSRIAILPSHQSRISRNDWLKNARLFIYVFNRKCLRSYLLSFSSFF